MPTLTNRWSVLALLFFARASMAMQFQSIAPLATLLVEELRLNYTQIGLLIGLFMFPGIFIALPGGLLGQRFGDKAVVLAGLALQAVGSLLLANADVFPVAFAARLLGGMGMVLLNVQLTKIVNDWFTGQEISTSMGILMTAWPFGMALALSTLGYVAEAWGWRAAIHVTTGYSALSLVLVGLFYRDLAAASPRHDEARPPLWVISNRELALITIAGLVWVLPNAGFIVVLGFTPALLIAGGMGLAAAGFLVGLMSWITIGSIPLGGWLTDRTGRGNGFIVTGVILNALAVALIPLGAPVLGCAVLFGLTMGGWPGAIMALPDQVLSPRGRSTGFGVFYTVYYALMAALLPVAGWLQDLTEQATASVLFGALLLVNTPVALLAFRLLQRRWAPAGAPALETDP